MSKPIASTPRVRSKPAVAAPASAPAPVSPAPVSTVIKPPRAALKPKPAPVAAAPLVETPIAAPAADPAPADLPPIVAAPAIIAPAITAPAIEAPAPIVADGPIPLAPSTPSPSAKELPMSETIDLSPAKNAFYDLQAKAKAGLEKSQALMAEASEFAKGNLEAAVESSKIAAAGVQELTGSFVAESKASFETLSAQVKELASAKSPTEFFKLHSDLTLKHFDNAVAYGSKHSEKLMKFASDVTAPLTARMSLAMEKLQKAA